MISARRLFSGFILAPTPRTASRWVHRLARGGATVDTAWAKVRHVILTLLRESLSSSCGLADFFILHSYAFHEFVHTLGTELAPLFDHFK